MTNNTRKVIAKIANYMTKNGASQSEAWKSAWKMYKQGWGFTLEGSIDYRTSQIGLEQVAGRCTRAHLAVVNCRGKYGNTYRQIQVRSNDMNVGFLPKKVANLLKYSDTVPFVSAELYTIEVEGKFEAKVVLKIAG